MKDSASIRFHRQLVMTRRVSVLASTGAKLLPVRVKTVLDVGAGTGEMAVALRQLIKDHIADSQVQHLILAFMDWVGNRAHHVALPNNYWSSQQWQDALRDSGVEIKCRVDDLPLYPRPFSWIFGKRLHNFWWIERQASGSNHE